jgi:hypothetical protein
MTVIPKVKRQCRVCQTWVETTARNLYLCDGCRAEANKVRARRKAHVRYLRRKALREATSSEKSRVMKLLEYAHFNAVLDELELDGRGLGV